MKLFILLSLLAHAAIEDDILSAVNQLRQSPQSFIPLLQSWKGKFEGKRVPIGPRKYLVTDEGTPAIDECIRYLRKARPVPRLAASPLLARAARDHVESQGKSGAIGHESPSDRIEKYGRVSGLSGENIAYGRYVEDSGRGVVLALAVDDGVPDRGHRDNLMNPRFREVGIACGSHPKFGRMCVMDFATTVKKK